MILSQTLPLSSITTGTMLLYFIHKRSWTRFLDVMMYSTPRRSMHEISYLKIDPRIYPRDPLSSTTSSPGTSCLGTCEACSCLVGIRMYLLRSAQTALRDASHSPTPQVFIECDCTMLEINPLASLTDGRVLVCDSKVGRVFRKKDRILADHWWKWSAKKPHA